MMNLNTTKKSVTLLVTILAAALFVGCGIDDSSGTISTGDPECVCNEDCDEGQTCTDGECVDETTPPECTCDEDCAEGQSCADGECVDLPECVEDTDCAEGLTCEEGACVEPAEPEFLPAPFASPECVAVEKASISTFKCDCIMDFSSYYTSGSTCGEVRGELTNMSWSAGPEILAPDLDGYMGMSYELDPGTFAFSYLGYQDCDDKWPGEAWAQYGHQDFLKQMTEEARSFIQCNWWDETTQTLIEVESPSCSLRITVSSDCELTGAGNMANFGQ